MNKNLWKDADMPNWWNRPGNCMEERT